MKKHLEIDKSKFTEVSLDDLPNYMPFIHEYLNGKYMPKTKNQEQVLREYNDDKWGSLYEKLKNKEGVNVYDVDKEFYLYNNKIVTYIDGHFYLANLKDVQSLSISIYIEFIKKYAGIDSYIYEFGAGYGSVFYKLATCTEFTKQKFAAAEYTNKGIKILKLISKGMNLNAQIGYCDIYNGILDELVVKKKSVIYTSYAMSYESFLQNTVMDFLIGLRPEYVIHFEPVYEHFDDNSLFHLLCKKYIEVEGYNRNLLTLIKRYENEGKIQILEESKVVIGANPLLPMSIIIWKLN